MVYEFSAISSNTSNANVNVKVVLTVTGPMDMVHYKGPFKEHPKEVTLGFLINTDVHV